MTKYDDYIRRGTIKHGAQFSPASLNQSFVDAYNCGSRVEVEFVSQSGEVYETKRGTIGVTTGWVPCFLLMLTKRSRGSSYTIGTNDRIKSYVYR